MVFVLDKHKKPLMPCSEKRGRLLLERRQAVIHKRHPFTIRLKDRVGGDVQPTRIKIDPGASTSGIALVREAGDGQHVLHLAEITHRAKVIRKHIQQRAMFRRRRRSANLRYRTPRVDNRHRPEGWLPPSLRSRLDNVVGRVKRYGRVVPIATISVENVRFDMQKLEQPEIRGVEYQQGTLSGYELREYLLEKWGRTCAYCGAAHVPLQIEHMYPKTRGGSDRASNLTLACRRCNEKKSARLVEEFLASKPAVLHRVLATAKKPLDAAAAINTVRWALVNALKATRLLAELGSGGHTKWNRSRLGVPKEHCLDAACVGHVEKLHRWNLPVLSIRCMGRGSYQRTRLTGVPSRIPDASEVGPRFPDWRHRTGGCADREEARHLRRSHSCARYGSFQHPDAGGCRARHQREALHDAQPCRWALLSHRDENAAPPHA